MKIRTGGCHCGVVSYRTTGDVRPVIFCHCKQCRKQTGHYVAASATVDKDITIQGEENLTWYAASDSAKRGFCKICGSLLFWKPNGSEQISIMAGSFDAPSGLKSAYHIYVADKGDYYEIKDGLPQAAQEM